MNDACPKCSGYMKLTEKDTSSGRDIREYKCSECGYSDWEDRGTALWQILSDDRKETEAKAKLSTAKTNTAAASQPPASKWKRFLAFIRPRRR
jgi:DNA-directed RNA polymerase subunit M/transcription elongation factor TFIIS